MIAADHRLLNSATAHSEAVLALVDALRAGRAAQWEVPPTARLRTALDLDDPTGEVATDPSRLRVRAHVEQGLLLLETATTAMQKATAALEASLKPYSDPVYTPSR